jgi:hypothetical protein
MSRWMEEGVRKEKIIKIKIIFVSTLIFVYIVLEIWFEEHKESI